MTQAPSVTKITFARSREFVGKVSSTNHGEVLYVAPGEKAEIEYRKFLENGTKFAEKKFFVVATSSRYGTLETAVAAAVAARTKN